MLVIDTPGFDEAKRTDSEILTEIARLLSAQYRLGVELKGIIYIHRITDIRYTGAAAKTFEIFKKICGDKPLKNVMFVTSRWADDMEELGSQREGELKENFWAYMLDKGSNMSRFYGDHDSAVMLISQLLIKESVVLELQHDLIDKGKKLNETAAGTYVNNSLEDLRTEYQKELASLEKLRGELLEQDRATKRRVQKDLEKEKVRLQETYEQQVSLQRRIGDEVHEEIKEKWSVTFLSGLSKVLPFIPTVLDILGSFVGIPPGVFTAAGTAVGSAVNSLFLSVN